MEGQLLRFPGAQLPLGRLRLCATAAALGTAAEAAVRGRALGGKSAWLLGQNCKKQVKTIQNHGILMGFWQLKKPSVFKNSKVLRGFWQLKKPRFWGFLRTQVSQNFQDFPLEEASFAEQVEVREGMAAGSLFSWNHPGVGFLRFDFLGFFSRAFFFWGVS